MNLYLITLAALNIPLFSLYLYLGRYDYLWWKLRKHNLNFDVKDLNIDDLRQTSRRPRNPAFSAIYPIEVTEAQLMRAQPPLKTTLWLPSEIVCTNILRFQNQILVKLVTPLRGDRSHDIQNFDVMILGKDTTNQPFLFHLPANYVTKSIAECEDWIIQRRGKEEVVAA